MGQAQNVEKCYDPEVLSKVEAEGEGVSLGLKD